MFKSQTICNLMINVFQLSTDDLAKAANELVKHLNTVFQNQRLGLNQPVSLAGSFGVAPAQEAT